MATDTVKFKKYQKVESTLGASKHAEKLKEIEESIAADALAAEELEELSEEEEEMGEEEEYEQDFSLSEGEPALNVGRIDLSFPETREEHEAANPQCYPLTYYTLSPKERLLLLYAENFRKQFVLTYPKRRALVLAVSNECNVQKFVCTSIRPTAFIHAPLIGNFEEIAKLVADYIEYEPLEDPINLPTRLMSPDTLLRKRRGNSYEMATLLCSMLIGAGFPAVVVSGIARIATVNNDQSDTPYPFAIEEPEFEEKETPPEVVGVKYKLRPLPDLKSHLDEQMDEIHRLKAEKVQLIKDELMRKRMDDLELLAVDRYHYRRSHAWVAIIDNAPWSIKPRITYTDENGDVLETPPSARFIEPATGFICEAGCKQYILIDSVWNETNYYVNKQNYVRVSDIRWDLSSNKDWEHLLPGEPPEMRVRKSGSDENVTDTQHDIEEEKHLDTIRTWVSKLHIGITDFEQRFPKQEKTVRYKGVIHERYSPYSQRDGKVMQVTIFEEDECVTPKIRYENYENRADHLSEIKFIYEDNQFIESFKKGRSDSLKVAIFYTDPVLPKKLYFYQHSRLDSVYCIEVYTDRTVSHYKNRSDRCWYREYEYKEAGSVLRKVTEKYSRNLEDDVPPNNDIAVRTFLFQQNKIHLKFHYNHGALTASTIEFNKPPKPDYGKELEYDEKYAKEYKANPTEPNRTSLELYKLLLEQLRQEDRVRKQFEKLLDDINTLFDLRRIEMKDPKLRFSIFDPLRNHAARAIRMMQNAQAEELKREIATRPADFLAPYLVPFKGQILTHEESLAAYNACLDDLKTRFVSLLNNLQRRYEDLTAESKSLKRFVEKFENQFKNQDYMRLIEEAKNIEMNKRMVQQRLTITHEESQKKYETVKTSLLRDPRLNLAKSFIKSKEDGDEAE